MRYRSLLGGAAHLIGSAVTHPIKTAFNITAGIKAGAEGADKLITPIMGISGLAMFGIGILHHDIALSGIGLTFASVAGGIYEHRGEEVRSAARAKVVESEKEAPPASEPVTEVEEKDPTPSEAAEIAAGETKGTGYGRRVSFKPNLPRPNSPIL